MKRYERYKPCGVEWIGQIPEHWDVERLKYTALVQPSNVDKKSLDGETSVLLCNYMDVYKNEFIDQSMNFMEATATDSEIEKFKIKKGDVLVTKDSETPDDIANPAFVKSDLENVICAYHLTQIRPERERLLGEYLFRLFQEDKYKAQFEVNANGVTRFGLSVSAFSDAFVPLPPTLEQTAIAAYLDEKTARIDKLIANKQRLIDLLKEERTAVINHAVTKGINPKVKLKPSGIEWLGDIPEHWEVKKLKYVVRILSGFSPEQCKPSEQENTLPYIKVDNLNIDHAGVNKTKEYTSEEFMVSNKPSLLFPKRGAAIALNKVATVDYPFCMDTNLMGFEIIDNKIGMKYLFYIVKNMSLMSIADTSTIPQINNKHIEPLEIPYPSEEEQHIIVQHIEFHTTRIDATISKIEKEIELMQEYRTALISEVVTGKIKVI